MRNVRSLKSKSQVHKVSKINSCSFEVVSGASGKVYSVALLENGASCSCDWAKYRPSENNGRCGCSHVISVFKHIEGEKSRSISAFTGFEVAERQHRPIIDIGDGVLLTTRKA